MIQKLGSTEITVQSMGLGLSHEVWITRRVIQRGNVMGEAHERCDGYHLVFTVQYW